MRRLALAAAIFAAAAPAHAEQRPNAAALLRILGPHAQQVIAPGRKDMAALVALPRGTTAESLGLEPVSPGIARVHGTPDFVRRFASAHPSMHVEVAPPLKLLLDRAGSYVRANLARPNVRGSGVLIGVADTGLDVTHPDFRTDSGNTRVAWMLDLSLKPIGRYPQLEEKFSIKDENGRLVAGAVLGTLEINDLLTRNVATPRDEVGHGTHVASIAAGNGGKTNYIGVAPEATLVVVRVTRNTAESIINDDLVRAVEFMFDRADFMKKPMVVNLSLGSTFGPHDGTMLWEQAIASHVGPDKPGRALVAAAGNSGSIVEYPIHQSVHVTEGTRMRVPITTKGANAGGVQIWITIRNGAQMRVGLDGPDGEWIAPIPPGQEQGHNRQGYNSGVINGSGVEGSPIPQGSNGAVVIWQGKWPAGTYHVTFEGDGTADLFMEGTGDASSTAAFPGAVREGTVNLPATNPAIIAVGCTVNRPQWRSIGRAAVGLRVPRLDPIGGLPDPEGGARDLEEGEVCWFSSAGPNVNGVPKPEISAPGAVIVGAMSSQAVPGSPSSIFTNRGCPKVDGKDDPRCLQIDATHGVAIGTSMSTPMVAGAIALLFEKDPTLTQDKVAMLLQAGAHPFRGNAPFQDQGGPGELDVIGSLDALEQLKDPKLYLPSRDKSWMTLSADYASAAESAPIVAIYELRNETGAHRAHLFEDRLFQPYALIDGQPYAVPAAEKKGPGLWTLTLKLPRGYGGSQLTLGATFNGEHRTRSGERRAEGGQGRDRGAEEAEGQDRRRAARPGADQSRERLQPLQKV